MHTKTTGKTQTSTKRKALSQSSLELQRPQSLCFPTRCNQRSALNALNLPLAPETVADDKQDVHCMYNAKQLLCQLRLSLCVMSTRTWYLCPTAFVLQSAGSLRVITVEQTCLQVKQPMIHIESPRCLMKLQAMAACSSIECTWNIRESFSGMRV